MRNYAPFGLRVIKTTFERAKKYPKVFIKIYFYFIITGFKLNFNLLENATKLVF